MKLKKVMALFIASSLLVTQPIATIANEITVDNARITLTLTQIDTWLSDLSNLAKTDPSKVIPKRDEYIKEVKDKYIMDDQTKAIWDAVSKETNFKDKNSTAHFIPEEDVSDMTVNNKPTANNNPTNQSNIKNDAGGTVNITEVKDISDKYNEYLSQSEQIFSKWKSAIVAPEGEDYKNVTSMVVAGTDMYRLQSDIALLEASALFSMIGNYTSFYGTSNQNAYETVMQPILNKTKNFFLEKGPYHATTVKVDYMDANGDGKFDNANLDNKKTVTTALFPVAMLGTEQVVGEQSVTGTQGKAFMPLNGAFHKGINSLYSGVSESPNAVQARSFLQDYQATTLMSSNIYTTPFSRNVYKELANKKVPTDETKVYVSEQPSKDSLFQLKTLLQHLITIPEELHNLANTPQTVQIWINENYDAYKKNVDIYQDMINFYKAFGYTAHANTLQVFLEDQKQKMDSITSAYGKTLDDSKEDELEQNLEHNKIFQNKNYYELLAWTSAFTPFETNLNAYDKALLHVSDASANLYKTNINGVMGQKRTPLFGVVGQKQVLTDIQQGNNRELTPVTLRSFMSSIETGDVMLYAQALSTEDLDKANSVQVNNTIQSDNTTGQNKSSTSINYSSIDASTNGGDFLGPVYFSTNDLNYGKAKQYNSYEKEARKLAKKETLEELQAKAKGFDVKAFAKELTSSQALSQTLTETHGYINYMLMHNTLENSASKSPAVQDDLDKPLYIDFLGNIVTHSGIVVVPAMANTTYFPSIENYSLTTAMFLNSYPKTASVRGSQLVLSPGDENKLMISLYPDKKKATTQQNDGWIGGNDSQEHAQEQGISNGRWKWKIIGADKDGKFDVQYNIERPNNVLYKTSTPVDGTIMRKGDEETKFDFFDPISGVIDVGISYASGDENGGSTETARIFTFEEFDELTVAGDGFVTKVALNNVSTDPTSGDWLALISLNSNHLLNQQYSLGVMSQVTLGHLYSVLMNCSTDVYSMSRYITLVDYKELLKNDGITKTFGSIFEIISNFFLEAIPTNLLTYTPTLNNLTMFKDMSLWITPIAIGLISIVIIIGLVYAFLGFFRRSGFEFGKVIYLLFAVPVIVFYSLNIHPQLMEYVFQTLPARIIEPELFLGVADQVESEYKNVNEYMFINKELLRQPNLTIKLQQLSNKQALEIRKIADGNQAYLDSPLYGVQYDQNIVNVLEDKVYMKGTEYFMDIGKLFELSDVQDKQNYDYTFRMDHDVFTGYEKIAPKLPYYHIAETLTHTINSFTEGSSVAMRTIDYGHFQKGTGRAQSYFNSIFFIAPDKFNEYLATVEYQHKKNLQTHIEDTETVLTKEELDELNKEVEEIVPMSLKAQQYMLEKMGDLDDWLGIKKILGLTNNISPFKPDYAQLIPTNEWFPDIHSYTEEELEQKVKNINTRTKNFVLTELVPVLTYMNDNTAIKTVALYATLQFNREFSTMTKQLYPVLIEPDSLSNHFVSRSIYMPRIDMFAASSNSLSYYVASQDMHMFALVDTVLRFFMYMLPIMAIFLLSFMPLLITVIYPFRETKVFKKVIAITKVILLIALMRFPILIAFKISDTASDIMGTTGGILVSVITTVLILAIIFLLIKMLKQKLLDTYGQVIDKFQDSVNGAINDLTMSVLGEEDPYVFYNNASSDIPNASTDAYKYADPYYNKGYSGSIYDSNTNSYERVDDNASYHNASMDGTGWRYKETRDNDDILFDDLNSYKEEVASASMNTPKTSDFNGNDKHSADMLNQDYSDYNNLSSNIDKEKKDYNATKSENVKKAKDLDITSDLNGDIEL